MTEKCLSEVYPPSEDTFLLIDSINQMKKVFKVAVEIGTGYGLAAIKLAEKSKYVIATDLNKKALLTAKNNSEKANVKEKIDFIAGDLLSFFRENAEIDVIAFNPPYVPENLIEDISWCGGYDGRTIIDRFLDQMETITSNIILLVQSTLSKPDKTREKLKSMKYFTEVERKPGFFEEIIIIKATLQKSQ